MDPPATVVVDARLARGGGHRTYLLNLLPRLFALVPEWRFELLAFPGDLAGLTHPEPGRIVVKTVSTALYGVAEQVLLARRARAASLVWIPHYNVPLVSRAPLVATVHDLAHLRLPEYGSVARRLYASLLHEAIRRRARGVIFVSEFTRAEFTALVGTPPGNSAVVPEAADPSWQAAERDASPRERPYFLMVGNQKPHKNHAAALAAFARVRDQLPHDLVFIGAGGAMGADLVRAERDRPGSRVALVERCDDASLRRHVRHATALLFPSTYEGFGLPPLEAMAAGCPVIASNAASIPEVCGDAALYFAPQDPPQLASHMLAVANDKSLAADLRARGRTRAHQFHWDRTARGTLDVLRNALASTR